jgi:hypothetical protein
VLERPLVREEVLVQPNLPVQISLRERKTNYSGTRGRKKTNKGGGDE